MSWAKAILAGPGYPMLSGISKLIFYANVFTGVLAPIMVIYLLAIGNSRKIMGEYKLGWLTNFFLALTALVLVASSVLFFYGLATGQGGS